MNDLRTQIKLLRNELDSDSVKNFSNIITEKVLSLSFIKDYKTFMVYKSFKNEVSTQKIIDYLLSIGKTVCYPVIKGSDLIAVIPKSNEFVLDGFGVLEPREYTVIEDVNVIFVPLIACDKNKNRIGFGKGYYDRFLSGKHSLKIGLCYDFQVVDKITPNEWDIPLDVIVTENKIIGDFYK